MLKQIWCSFVILILSILLIVRGSPSNDSNAIGQTNCGKVLVEVKSRMSYSDDTFAGKYPWHVAIHQLILNGSRKYICGGNIITTNAILTVAHCVLTEYGIINVEALRVAAGLYNLSDTENSQEARVIQIISHEKFNRQYFENDITIL